RVAADAVLELDPNVVLGPESDDRIVAIAAMVAGLTLEPDHLALRTQAGGLEASDLCALIDANSEENDREDGDDRGGLPALPRLRQRRRLHVRTGDELLDRLDAGEIDAGRFTKAMLLAPLRDRKALRFRDHDPPDLEAKIDQHASRHDPRHGGDRIGCNR